MQDKGSPSTNGFVVIVDLEEDKELNKHEPQVQIPSVRRQVGMGDAQPINKDIQHLASSPPHDNTYTISCEKKQMHKHIFDSEEQFMDTSSDPSDASIGFQSCGVDKAIEKLVSDAY